MSLNIKLDLFPPLSLANFISQVTRKLYTKINFILYGQPVYGYAIYNAANFIQPALRIQKISYYHGEKFTSNV